MQRQIKSCTHCRQHKVKCDAMKCKDKKCTRCQKYSLECVIDQHFKPRKGGQVEILREHLAEMQKQLETITQTKPNLTQKRTLEVQVTPPIKQKRVKVEENLTHTEIEKSVAERMAAGGRLEPVKGPYKLQNITLSEENASKLYDYFMANCEPFIPIFEEMSAGELYARSEFLFWAVMTTGALGEPTSELYLSLVGPMKELAAKKCLIETTRSSSIVQALLILCTYPLPSEKMLEDMSPRYCSLAYQMGLQLGIHRGKFIYEFSRNQQLMPNAVKWRSLTWVQTYITQQMISASTGIPPSMPLDHVIDNAFHDEEHPLSPRISALLKISIFYSKLVSIMGSSVSTMDGLMEPSQRCPTLDLLKTDLYTMFPPSQTYEDPVVEIAFLYARCILSSFAFLPDTPLDHQTPFIMDAFHACTRIVTVVRKMVDNQSIVEMPSFVRNPCSLSALLLFRLQLLPQMPEQCVASCRESIVTVHHMYRNLHPSWLSPVVSNDISRVAKVLESLNHVMITYPELLHSKRVMRHMRSHLTFSIFYEFLYILHEARRRNASNSTQQTTTQKPAPQFEESSPDSVVTSPNGAMRTLIHQSNNPIEPLPLFNDISLASYIQHSVVSPNGTTLTTLTRTAPHSPQPEFQNTFVTNLTPPLETFDKKEFNEPQVEDIDSLFVGLDWMNTEGDDFLGWMMPRDNDLGEVGR